MIINMYVYIHTHIHTYTHTHIHTYTHTYIHTYIHTHIHTYIHVYMYVRFGDGPKNNREWSILSPKWQGSQVLRHPQDDHPTTHGWSAIDEPRWCCAWPCQLWTPWATCISGRLPLAVSPRALPKNLFESVEDKMSNPLALTVCWQYILIYSIYNYIYMFTYKYVIILNGVQHS